MLKRNRHYILAGLGLAFFSLFLGVGFQKIDQWNRYEAPADSPAKTAEKGVINTARIANALEAIQADEQSKDTSERARRDLDAQEGAARWTKWSAWAAVVQLFVSGLGLGALIYTLKQTDISLKEARRANRISALEAKRARREAVTASLERVREFTIQNPPLVRVNRPAIWITGYEFPPINMEMGQKLSGEIWAYNAGISEAVISRAEMMVYWGGRLLPMISPLRTATDKIVFPVDRLAYRDAHRFSFEFETVGPLYTLYLIGEIIYSGDEYGRGRHTLFARKYDVDTWSFVPVENVDYEQEA